MFYKTCNGAEVGEMVGDIHMSLISTCELCGVSPPNYLQASRATPGT